MGRINVKKHIRKGRNKAFVVARHTRKGHSKKGDRAISLTHRVKDGDKEVFVDGFWKHDYYPDAPKAGWSYERLVKERQALSEDLDQSLHGGIGSLHGYVGMPARKFGVVTRRIKKIDKLLKQKRKKK